MRTVGMFGGGGLTSATQQLLIVVDGRVPSHIIILGGASGSLVWHRGATVLEAWEHGGHRSRLRSGSSSFAISSALDVFVEPPLWLPKSLELASPDANFSTLWTRHSATSLELEGRDREPPSIWLSPWRASDSRYPPSTQRSRGTCRHLTLPYLTYLKVGGRVYTMPQLGMNTTFLPAGPRHPSLCLSGLILFFSPSGSRTTASSHRYPSPMDFCLSTSGRADDQKGKRDGGPSQLPFCQAADRPQIGSSQSDPSLTNRLHYQHLQLQPWTPWKNGRRRVMPPVSDDPFINLTHSHPHFPPARMTSPTPETQNHDTACEGTALWRTSPPASTLKPTSGSVKLGFRLRHHTLLVVTPNRVDRRLRTIRYNASNRSGHTLCRQPTA
ncbi:hypothetical protein EV126DRAFT_182935 [Verticillium dahliae]|nr:hypothetical protein EV126DRAFT_182935 [Verticillium dahliae]